MFVLVNRFSTDLMESSVFGMLLKMITPGQCRAARGLLDWSQQDLADQAGVGIVTVRQLEAGLNEPRRSTLDVVRRAFERAGVELIEKTEAGRVCAYRSGGEQRGLTDGVRKAEALRISEANLARKN